MEIPPAYWTLLGEIAAIFIGVLIAVIIVVLRDRKKLREYTEHLKQIIKKLKKKFKESEDQPSQEKALSSQQELPQQKVSKTSDADDDLKLQLENAAKQINNLQQFKQLYFELQSKLSKSVLEIENLNEKIAELSDGSEQHDAIQSVIEKNKAVYLEMGQMIGMDKEQHHESVANTMDYSETIISERKEEIKRLKSQIAQQFEDIWALQSGLTAKEGTVPDPEVLSAGIETVSHNLKDAEMCIETMDMEIQTQCSEISNLKNQLKQHRTSGNEAKLSEYQQVITEKEQIIARFAQENKELMSCISGLESSNMEQSSRIKKLEEQNAELKAD